MGVPVALQQRVTRCPSYRTLSSGCLRMYGFSIKKLREKTLGEKTVIEDVIKLAQLRSTNGILLEHKLIYFYIYLFTLFLLLFFSKHLSKHGSSVQVTSNLD